MESGDVGLRAVHSWSRSRQSRSALLRLRRSTRGRAFFILDQRGPSPPKVSATPLVLSQLALQRGPLRVVSPVPVLRGAFVRCRGTVMAARRVEVTLGRHVQQCLTGVIPWIGGAASG